MKTFRLYANIPLNPWKPSYYCICKYFSQPMKTFILYANTPLNQWKPSHYMQIVLSTNENLPIMFLWVIANKNQPNKLPGNQINYSNNISIKNFIILHFGPTFFCSSGLRIDRCMYKSTYLSPYDNLNL